MPDEILVEVCFALPEHQEVVVVRVPRGTTVEAAIIRSGIQEKFTEIDLARNKVGIYGKLTKLSSVLRDHDRVEIYRPLRVDPREARRLRVERQRRGNR